MLLELFTSKVRYKVEKNTREKFTTSAVINGRKILFYATLSFNADVWHVGFSEARLASDQKERFTSKLTGSGAAPAVLKMVIDSLKEFIELKQPTFIEFSAAKDSSSRASVYERMLKRMLPSWTVSKHEGLDIRFELTKDRQESHIRNSEEVASFKAE